jgi:cob(I)alamin adenosyltransferase
LIRQDLGRIHVYTGSGKGKTTAALGQAIRSLGAGLLVTMVNFLKNDSSEFKTLNCLAPEFQYIIANQETRGFYWELTEEQKAATRQDCQAAWKKVKDIVNQHQSDMLILDEIMAVIEYGIIPVEVVTAIIQQCRHSHIELVLTGRNAPAEIIREADLVTEMREIKHPLAKGITARPGIEY